MRKRPASGAGYTPRGDDYAAAALGSRPAQPGSSYLNPVHHLTTSAMLLLVAATALGGLGVAESLTSHRRPAEPGAADR